MHPLDGAYERVIRAGVHLRDLNRRVNILGERISDSIVVYQQPRTFLLPNGERVEAFSNELSVPVRITPGIISILVGEIIYNLRSALDYLIYELARLDSGEVQDDTQFIIEDCEKDFRRRRQSKLKGISYEHVAIIERLQPFNGCDWIQILRDLSNPDKHRKLSETVTYIAPSRPQGSTERIATDESVDMKNNVSVQITFSEGKIVVVIDTLKQLKSEVAKTLHLFDSEFK